MSEEKYYRIGEVAEMLNLKTHVLRFWETEFAQLDPLRTESGQRLYTEKNVNMLRRIQQLLHEQGMTIEGAKRILAGGSAEDCCVENTAPCADSEFLDDLGEEIRSICNLLRQGDRE